MNEWDRDANPWLHIPAEDYEGHMGSGGVDQLDALDRIMGAIYADVRPRRLVILGCGTGNGFRHIDPEVTVRAVGVDINPAYIEIARRRHPGLKGILELSCSYAEKCAFDPGSFDMVHAALLLEYLEPEPMISKIASWLVPGGTASFVIQEPGGGNGPVSETPFKSLMALAGVWSPAGEKKSPAPAGNCAIITLPATGALQTIHSRQPALIARENFDLWLDSRTPITILESLLGEVQPQNWQVYPVSPRVNSPANNDPELLQPLSGDHAAPDRRPKLWDI